MTRTIVILGRKPNVVEDAQNRLNLPGVKLLGGTNIDDMRAAFAQAKIDHVIMGAGIDLEKRLEIVRAIFELSDTTTVHMKDRATGPESFLPFVRSLVGALSD